MLYFLGFINYGDKEADERLDRQLVHECLTQCQIEDFEDYSTKDSRHWLSFSEEVLKKLDLAHCPALAERVQELLTNEKARCQCWVCDQIGLNMPMIHYRDHGGCIGKAPECCDCKQLENQAAGEIIEIRKEKGVPAAIQRLKELRD